jgi:hypothetical protein
MGVHEAAFAAEPPSGPTGGSTRSHWLSVVYGLRGALTSRGAARVYITLMGLLFAGGMSSIIVATCIGHLRKGLLAAGIAMVLPFIVIFVVLLCHVIVTECIPDCREECGLCWDDCAKEYRKSAAEAPLVSKPDPPTLPPRVAVMI